MQAMNSIAAPRLRRPAQGMTAALRNCVFALGVAVAGMASAHAAAEYRVADFSKPAETAEWNIITDKWAKGDSTLDLQVVKADEQPVLSVKSKLGTKYGYPFTGARRFFKPGGVPVDMSAYKGVRLRVRGNGEFKLQVQSAAVADFNEFAVEVPVEKQWRVVDLPFSQFAQSPYWGKQVKWNPVELRGLVLFFDGLPGAPEVAVEVGAISLYK